MLLFWWTIETTDLIYFKIELFTFRSTERSGAKIISEINNSFLKYYTNTQINEDQYPESGFKIAQKTGFKNFNSSYDKK